MNFLSALKKKKEEGNFFLALLLKPYSVGAILFEQTASSLAILSTKEEKLEKPLEEEDEEGLLDRTDAAISFTESGLPPGGSVDKTIIALPLSWQEEGKIKKDYQPILKKICHDLQLVPIGFIVTIEAIAHALQEKEGAPVSAIFVEVSRDRVFVYLTRSGKILVTKTATVEKGDIVSSVETLLSEAEFDVLPPRIILLDHENAEDVAQKFLSYNWKKELSFMHLPQVVVLEKGFENEAVINGVANQMGFEITSHVVKNAPDEEQEELPEQVSAEEFGFAREVDVAEVQAESEPEDEKKEEERPKILIREGEKEFEDLPEPKIDDEEKKDYQDIQNVEPVESQAQETKGALPSVPGLNIAKLGAMIPLFMKKMSAKSFGVIILVVFVLVAFLYLYYTAITKAEVVVFADKRTFERSEDVIFSEEQTSGKDKVIHANYVNITVDGQEEKATTGKKETGDKATGEIVVYNKTEKSKSFPKGTVVASSNNLNFLTLDEVKISSTSSFSTTFSSSKVKIEAEEFGKEYNLPSNTNFTVDNQSTTNYFAKNDSPLSGGSKKEIRVVSGKDMDSLEEEIQKNLEKNAREKLNEKLNSEVAALPSVLSAKFVEKKFNKKEGDEASELTLSAKLDFKFGTYNLSDLVKTVDDLSQDSIPRDYKLVDEKSDIKIENIKTDKEGNVGGTLKINALYMPQIGGEDISKQLTGKSEGEAEKILKEIPGVSEVQIVFKRKYPLLPGLLPFNSKNITVTLKTDG